jgi:uncharacterized membrane protein YjjP (DUF1212 family)
LLSPIITFAFILATLYGAAFHLILGGDARRFAVFLLSSWIGFGLGQVVGLTFQVDFYSIGSLRVFSATLGSLVALAAASFLTSKRLRKRPTKRATR